jgi:hypothetical protein
MDGTLAPILEEEKPRQTGERRFGHRALNVEVEERLHRGRPLFRQPEPSVLAYAALTPGEAISTSKQPALRGM